MTSQEEGQRVVRIRPEQTTDTRQGMPYFLGYGPRLEHSVVTEVGDFLFIPPGVPHQALNLSRTERAVGLVARDNSSEQEAVVLYDPPPGATS